MVIEIDPSARVARLPLGGHAFEDLQAIVVVGEFLQVGPGDLPRDQRIVVRHVGLRIMSPVLELYLQSTPEHTDVERGTVEIETDQRGNGPRLHLRETTSGACIVVGVDNVGVDVDSIQALHHPPPCFIDVLRRPEHTSWSAVISASDGLAETGPSAPGWDRWTSVGAGLIRRPSLSWA